MPLMSWPTAVSRTRRAVEDAWASDARLGGGAEYEVVRETQHGGVTAGAAASGR